MCRLPRARLYSVGRFSEKTSIWAARWFPSSSNGEKEEPGWQGGWRDQKWVICSSSLFGGNVFYLGELSIFIGVVIGLTVGVWRKLAIRGCLRMSGKESDSGFDCVGINIQRVQSWVWGPQHEISNVRLAESILELQSSLGLVHFGLGTQWCLGFPGGFSGKESSCNAEVQHFCSIYEKKNCMLTGIKEKRTFVHYWHSLHQDFMCKNKCIFFISFSNMYCLCIPISF